MVLPRSCTYIKETGGRCMATPLHDKDLCFWHDPETQEQAAEARRLGGLRRRREGAIVGAYEVGELDTVEDLRRLLQIAVIDTLGLENSISRSRTLGYLAQVGAMLLERGEQEQRLQELEALLRPRLLEAPSQRRW
jgi:hypothetical protein